MRTFFAHKFWVILLAVLAVVALTELAIGLRSMSFREAQAFGLEEAGRVGPVSLEALDSFLAIPLPTQFIFWAVFILMFVLISLLLSPEWRKRLIRAAIRTAVIYWALYIVFTRYRERLAQMNLDLAAMGNTPNLGANGEPAPAFAPPESGSWLVYLLSFGVAVLLIFMVWKGYGIWQELHPQRSSEIRKLAKIARASLADLSSGGDTSDVIIHCYQRMSEVVAHRKNLERKESMTPGEFASRLEEAGLPGEAVRTLTRLFETVRYGAHKSNPKMDHEAVACLTTILHYCGEGA
jgi:hypothetical protein